MNQPETDQPALTGRELYLQLEGKAKAEMARGEKANEIRKAIIAIAAEVGKKKLAVRALFPVVRKRVGFTVARPHFMKVCEHNWEMTTDDNGLVWIDLERGKSPKAKT